MKLVLDDGTEIRGKSFGAARSVRGEVVFNTGLTGYVETLTDPSYRGQILVLTYPLQGNYGVSAGPFESGRIQVQGLVIGRCAPTPSHHASQRSLAEWLRAEGIAAIEDVDTRTLTRRLREQGTMGGALLADDAHADAADAVDMKHVVKAVSPTEVVRYPGSGARLLLVDAGAKENIVRSLLARQASVIRAPAGAPWDDMLSDVDGVVISNGPGDPADLAPIVDRLRRVLARGLPTFGICLGHQLLALAAGAKTYKLKYGHRSQNQPVLELSTGRAYVTSQNHGYAVESALPADWEASYVNLNDGTNEGMRHRYRPFWSVQFHPEAAAGPHDTAFMFDDFLRMVGATRRSARA
jgi:carbamoyl-phosphate synthase small subunit